MIKNLHVIKNPSTILIISLLSKYEGKKGLKKVQKALVIMGEHLQVDGDIGPITLNILKSIKHKILHKTILNLDTTVSNTIPKWLELAKQEIGTKEIHGMKHNPRVLEYHSVSGGFATDEIPWCASFVNFIMIKSGFKTVKYPARAKSWLKFGKSSKVPVIGSIAVKSRKGGGHVGFVIGKDETKKYLYILGGNQNDEVNIRKYKVTDFIDFRVPSNYNNYTLPLYKSNKINKNNKED